MASPYTQVTAITDLPSSHFLYEANCNLQCAGCNATIPVGSYFARKVTTHAKKPLPHCRKCKPVQIYTSPNKTAVAAPDEEYQYISPDIFRGV